MSKVNISTNGDGNVVNTGDHTNLAINTNISKRDLNGLAKALEEIKVSKEDISEIENILKNDPPDYQSQSLGKDTRSWISKMLTKTLDGTWQVATGAAGGMLVELLKKFWGI